MPPGTYQVSDVFSHREVAVELTEGLLTVDLDEPFSGAALLLTPTDPAPTTCIDDTRRTNARA